MGGSCSPEVFGVSILVIFFFFIIIGLDIRKKFFTVRLRHWNRLPRDAVNVSSLEAFNARLDEALSNLV